MSQRLCFVCPEYVVVILIVLIEFFSNPTILPLFVNKDTFYIYPRAIDLSMKYSMCCRLSNVWKVSCIVIT